MRIFLLLLTGLLLAPRPSPAQRMPGAMLQPDAPAAGQPAPRLSLAADRRVGRVTRRVLTGSAIGAAVGSAAFLYVEVTKEHWDHSEDGLVFATLTVPATAFGAFLGLLVGIAERRSAAEERGRG